MKISNTTRLPNTLLLGTVIGLLGLLLAACGGSDNGSGSGAIFRTRPGDCFNDPPDGRQVEVEDVVACSQPHDNEVFATIAFPAPDGAPFPGRDEVIAYAEQSCLEPFVSYVGLAYEKSRYTLLPAVPTEHSWTTRNDRQIVCALYDSNVGQMTGSARNSGL